MIIKRRVNAYKSVSVALIKCDQESIVGRVENGAHWLYLSKKWIFSDFF